MSDKFRTRSGFLFLPKWIGNEWQWLVYATWKQELINGEWVDVWWLYE